MRKLILIFICLFNSTVNADETAKRIITIGGSLTEIVYQLGAGNNLVASDTTSYFPIEAEKLPKVGYQRALSTEGILSLNPDIVILTDEAGPSTVIAQLKTTDIKLLTLKSGRSINDVIENINVIAEVIDKNDMANELIKKLNKEKLKLEKIVSTQKQKHKVMFILQYGGGVPMVAGRNTAADSIIKLSGVDNVVTEYMGYKPLTPEAAVALAPDIILITEQGLKQLGGKTALMKIPGLALTPAGKNKRIVAMDSLLLLGFGPRTVNAALQLNQHYQKL